MSSFRRYSSRPNSQLQDKTGNVFTAPNKTAIIMKFESCMKGVDYRERWRL